MKNKRIRLFIVSISIFMMSAVNIYAQQAFDQYGFSNRAFLIQSALEAGKSGYGFWDVPGTARKTDGNLKGTKWMEMGVYQREQGDPDDRLFSFSPGQNSAAGKYFIRFAREMNWGVNYIPGNGKIEARSGIDAFELKNIGGDKWKIYVKPGYVMCVDNNSAKNGSKIVVKPDHNGNDAVWVFYDLATLKSFIPASTRSSSSTNSSYKGVLKDSISYKTPGTQYFQMADGEKFKNENANGELQAYLNDMKTSDQWAAILNLVKAVKDNKDVEARRSMYKAISEAEVKAGSNFAENLLKGKFVEQINDVARSEKDSTAKGYITVTAEKIN
ncbi:MAG: hypothetical protein CVV49_01565 [Spirochaetae bacterium HGW-Spirochaetae-5]|nr:MAG: hypothetical protein CVV49_01565 [Spirochaetae bacterium HGW-Spirochaetae-5]